MVFNDVSKTSGRPSQPSRGKQGDDEGVSRHQHERDSVELYRALFERNLNLSDTRRSWLPTRGPSEARTSAGAASPHPKKHRRNHKSRPKNWFERYEPMKGKKVPDNCTPMEMLFFEKVADKRHCQSGDAVRSRKSLVSGRWDEENDGKLQAKHQHRLNETSDTRNNNKQATHAVIMKSYLCGITNETP